jgi:hypothetical protein
MGDDSQLSPRKPPRPLNKKAILLELIQTQQQSDNQVSPKTSEQLPIKNSLL